MKVVIQPGSFDGNRPAMVIDTNTNERTRVEQCKRWQGDHTCWDTTDETGKRRIFLGSGIHAFGTSAIVVNYTVEQQS